MLNAASNQGRHLFGGSLYSGAACIRGRPLFVGGLYSGRPVFGGSLYSGATFICKRFFWNKVSKSKINYWVQWFHIKMKLFSKKFRSLAKSFFPRRERRLVTSQLVGGQPWNFARRSTILGSIPHKGCFIGSKTKNWLFWKLRENCRYFDPIEFIDVIVGRPSNHFIHVNSLMFMFTSSSLNIV